MEKVITPSIAAWCGISFPGYNATSNPLTYAHRLFVGDKENNTEVTDVVVPDGIEDIKPLAFYGFTAMSSLTLPSTVTKLGDYAFYACTGLTEVTLPEGFEDIGRGVFDGCTSLTTLSLPSTLTRIDYYAFMDVPLLTAVFCSADPSTLNWQNNASQFLPEKATQFHVPEAEPWEEKFPDANVTYIADLIFATAEDYEGDYDKAGHSITVNVKAPTGTTVMYGLTEEAYDLDTNPVYTDAGTYTVYYQVTKEGYIPVEGSAVVTIHMIPGTIDYAVTSLEKERDEAPFTNELTIEGDGQMSYESSDEQVVTVDQTGLVTIKGFGSATITATVSDGTNYFYGDDNRTLTYTVYVYRDMSSVFPTDGAWATYVAKEDLATPDGLKAYVVSEADGTTVTATPIDYIPAGVGILLNRSDVKVSAYKGDGYMGATSSFESKLVGSATDATSLTPYKDFVLFDDEFMLSSSATIPAARAYLPAVKVPAGARRMTIVIDGEATGIDSMMLTTDDGAWYSIDGRRLNGRPAAKGLYIHQGRKIVIRQ